MAVAPVFFTTPFLIAGQVSTANTARDGTGTLVDLKTGAAGGSRVDEVRVKASVTTTAGMIRLFINDGSNTRLFDEVPVAAATVSGTVEANETIVIYDNFILPENHVLRAATHNAEAINVFVHGADV